MENVKAFKHDRVQSLSHALEILDDAAKDNSEELKMMLNRDFRRVKEAISDVAPDLEGTFAELKEKSRHALNRVKDSAIKVDDSVHESPWIYMGALAASVGLLGYFIGRRGSK